DDGRTGFGVEDQTEPIAIFQHEVGPRQDVGVAAANLHDLHRAARRMRHVSETHAHHAWLRHIDHHVIEVPTVGDRLTRRPRPLAVLASSPGSPGTPSRWFPAKPKPGRGSGFVPCRRMATTSPPAGTFGVSSATDMPVRLRAAAASSQVANRLGSGTWTFGRRRALNT